MRQYQKGISLSGFITFAIVLCVFGLLAIRIVPVYLDHYSIVHALKSVRTLPKSELKKPPVVARKYILTKVIPQLQINGFNQFLEKDVKIKRLKKGYNIRLPYTVKRKLIGNIELLFTFDPEVEVRIFD